MNYQQLKRENREKIEKYIPDPENGSVDFYPRYIQIEQTNKCNAQCIMCNHFYLGNKGASDISREVMQKLEHILPYCETVMLNGDGEPFLSSNIIDAIKMLSHYGVEIGTNTNLCYIPNELWSHFEKDFKFLNISCDGASAKIFEIIRKGLSFQTFTSNLERLAIEAPHLKKNFDCVVMKQNIKELPEIVKLASKYGISRVKFQRLGVNGCIGNQEDEAEYYYSDLMENLQKAREVGKELQIEVSFPDYKEKTGASNILDEAVFIKEINHRYKDARTKFAHLTLESDYYSELVNKEELRQEQWCANKVCQWAIERCYIDLKGNVTTCCFNMKKYMGNLYENTFDEIWNGQTYRELRKMMSEEMLPAFCRQCNWIKDAKF